MSAAKSFLGVVIALSTVGAAAAQENVTRSGTVEAGKVVRLGTVSALKTDCSIGQVGSIRVINSPQNGTISLKGGKSKTSSTFRCPNVETPVQGIFYQSKAKFEGTDEVVYEAQTQEGRTVKHTVKITVTNKPGKKSGDLVDL